jgi:hypothetical protein
MPHRTSWMLSQISIQQGPRLPGSETFGLGESWCRAPAWWRDLLSGLSGGLLNSPNDFRSELLGLSHRSPDSLQQLFVPFFGLPPALLGVVACRPVDLGHPFLHIAGCRSVSLADCRPRPRESRGRRRSNSSSHTLAAHSRIENGSRSSRKTNKSVPVEPERPYFCHQPSGRVLFPEPYAV